jgi:hypothetical protein
MSDIPEIQSEYSTNYRRINATGIFGGITPSGLEAIVYSEERRADRVLQSPNLSPNRIYIKRTVECELLIDPMQMKSMYRWLEEKIREYERIFGPIPSPEEVSSRTRRDPHQ